MKPLFLLALFSLFSASALAVDEQAEQLFVRRIAPLFHEKCLACHGNDEAKIKGDLDMRSLASVLRGGESGQSSLMLGKPEESPLYLAATRTHDDWEAMPPKEADKLYGEQIGWIKDWIAGGAPWPDEARQREIATANEAKWSAEDGITVKTAGALSPEWANRKYKPESLWGYQAVREPDGETGRQEDKGRNRIDALIAIKMPVGLDPAPAADARTLIRRATFDLTGLPPTPEEVEALEEVEAFTAAYDQADDALVQDDLFRSLIDRHAHAKFPLRRAHGPALAGCHPLCGQQRLCERLRTGQRLALP
ncbi:MAG: DUF1549 domain-containing protein [Verrucomicrobia bacterium]|nr:DUF1549 domain-containing protein [Verrucomicrobiota bacterium]